MRQEGKGVKLWVCVRERMSPAAGGVLHVVLSRETSICVCGTGWPRDSLQYWGVQPADICWEAGQHVCRRAWLVKTRVVVKCKRLSRGKRNLWSQHQKRHLKVYFPSVKNSVTMVIYCTPVTPHQPCSSCNYFSLFGFLRVSGLSGSNHRTGSLPQKTLRPWLYLDSPVFSKLQTQS